MGPCSSTFRASVRWSRSVDHWPMVMSTRVNTGRAGLVISTLLALNRATGSCRITADAATPAMVRKTALETTVARLIRPPRRSGRPEGLHYRKPEQSTFQMNYRKTGSTVALVACGGRNAATFARYFDGAGGNRYGGRAGFRSGRENFRGPEVFGLSFDRRQGQRQGPAGRRRQQALRRRYPCLDRGRAGNDGEDERAPQAGDEGVLTAKSRRRQPRGVSVDAQEIACCA